MLKIIHSLTAMAFLAIATLSYAQNADLQITKGVNDDNPDEGQAITFTIEANNEGPDHATGVQVLDLLPAGVTYVSNTPEQGSYNPTNGIWTVGTVNKDSNSKLEIDVTVDAGTAARSITNTASVAALDQNDPDPANDAESVIFIVNGADLEVIKTVDNLAPAEGETVTYTIIVTNKGPLKANDIDLTDVLPAGVTYVSSTESQGDPYDPGTGLWDVNDLNMDDFATLTIDATVDAGTLGLTITNTAAITAVVEADSITGNNQGSAIIAIGEADLAVTKTVNDLTPNESDPVVYTLIATNSGPHTAPLVEVMDLLPDAVSYVSDNSGGAYNPVSGTWDLGSFAPGASATLVITGSVNVGTAAQTVTNLATIASPMDDPNNTNDTGSAVFQVHGADLAVIKTASDSRPDEGDSLDYIIVVVNQGPDPATGIVVTDFLPTGLSLTGITPTQGSYTEGNGEWTVGSLAPNTTATLTLSTTVDAGGVIRNTAAVDASDQPDSVTGNNQFTVTISATKSFAGGSCIVDLGVVPQTEGNGLKPYGLVYDLVVNNQIPVWWAFDPDKSFVTSTNKTDQVDFTVDGKDYKGSAFIISAEFVATAQPIINTWIAKGVVVDCGVSAFTTTVHDVITSFPNAVLDEDNGNVIASAFYAPSEVPASSYITGTPADLSLCDDIYAMPHADPHQWTDESQYKTTLLAFIQNGGYLWAACHAVSSLEGLVDIDGDSLPDLNFLSNNGLVPWTDHDDGTPPYEYSLGPGEYNLEAAGDPFMQWIGTVDGALQGGSEAIYIPFSGGWRSTTTVAVYDPDHPEVIDNTYPPGPAAALVYGRAFSNPDYGIVMYEASHSVSGGSEAENVAAARAYGNLLLQAGIERRPNVDGASIPTDYSSGANQPVSVLTSGGTPPYRYQWTNSCGGSFVDRTESSTSFTAPIVTETTECIVRVEITDACGRKNFVAQTVTVQPPGGLDLSKSADVTFAGPEDIITYTVNTEYSNDVTFLSNPVIQDVIPANTTYVPGSVSLNGVFDPASNRVVWALGSSSNSVPGVFESTASVSLPAIKTTYIEQNNPNNTHGGEAVLVSARGAGALVRPLLQFDLSGIPTDIIIDDAQLRLFTTIAQPGQTMSVHAMVPRSPWTEAGASWNFIDGTLAWFEQGGDFDLTSYGSLIPATAGQYNDVEVSDLVGAWIDGIILNEGVILDPFGGSGQAEFSSRTVAGQEPLLDITYTAELTLVQLSARPLLVSDGGLITVTMDVQVFGNDSPLDVTPPVALGVLATGDAGAVLVGGPTPSEAQTIPVGGSTLQFIYVYEASASVVPSSLAFTGSPTSSDPAFSFFEARSNSSLVVPELSFQVQVDPALSLTVTQVINKAEFFDDAGFAAPNTVSSPPVTTDVSQASFAISKVLLTPSDGVARTGEAVSFSITVTNKGVVVLNELRLEDNYDASLLSFVSATPPPEDPTNGSLVWTNVGPLAVGTSTSLVVNLVATNSSAGVLSTNSATVSYTPPVGKPAPPDKTSTATFSVIAPSIAVSKSPSSQQVFTQGTATFTISVTNTGDVVLSNVTVSDPLAPACDLLLPTLAAGASTNYVCTVTNVTSDFTNTVFVNGTPPDGPDVGDSDQAAVDWIPSADLAITKSASPDPAVAGRTLVYTITVTNNGPDDATNVQVTEFLPASVSYQSDVPSQGSYNSISGVWDVGGLAVSDSATLEITVMVNQ